jgi:hypothetical protein
MIIPSQKAPLKCGQTNNPTIKVLLLHGGPGLTHSYTNVSMVIFPTKVSNTSIMIN